MGLLRLVRCIAFKKANYRNNTGVTHYERASTDHVTKQTARANKICSKAVAQIIRTAACSRQAGKQAEPSKVGGWGVYFLQREETTYE